MAAEGSKGAAMGDLSSEPSMEEILSSIKRIIAEEGDTAPRIRRAGRPSPVAGPETDEILELSDPIPAERAPPVDRGRSRPDRPIAPPRAAEPEGMEDEAADAAPVRAAQRPAEPRPAPAPIVAERASSPAGDDAPRSAAPEVSQGTVDATRGALDHLSRMLVRPATSSDGTLEGLVREMIRPMLRDWLDANLPSLAEELVAREIGRITGSRR